MKERTFVVHLRQTLLRQEGEPVDLGASSAGNGAERLKPI
jgi:hypothetical protein